MMAAERYAIGSDVWPGLSKMIEEFGEAQQVFGKLVGSGGDPKHFDGTDLTRRLEEELGDCMAAMSFFLKANPSVREAQVYGRAADKLDLFRKWHRENLP